VNNIFVYCEIEDGNIAEVSLELLTKGRKLANEIDRKLEALVIGHNLNGIENIIFPYGVDVVHIADNSRLYPYLTLPHTEIVVNIFKQEQPEMRFLVQHPLDGTWLPAWLLLLSVVLLPTVQVWYSAIILKTKPVRNTKTCFIR
jgi:electron transfer flavoprotein alpha subunit